VFRKKLKGKRDEKGFCKESFFPKDCSNYGKGDKDKPSDGSECRLYEGPECIIKALVCD
jgi:hypothetical protein